ncbi:MAG TPA: hypothetical protein VI318_08665 [Baekduia sp.]
MSNPRDELPPLPDVPEIRGMYETDDAPGPVIGFIRWLLQLGLKDDED